MTTAISGLPTDEPLSTPARSYGGEAARESVILVMVGKQLWVF
jgi:hypothetical protein